MNEAAWRELAAKLATMSSLEEVRAELAAPAATINTLANDHEIGAWMTAVVSSCSLIENGDIVAAFYVVLIEELYKWLLADRDGRMDGFIHFTAMALDSGSKLVFTRVFADFMAVIFPDPANIDINHILALQAAVFGFVVAKLPESEEVASLWFMRFAESRGSEIFKGNLPAALSYFKMMNHAFFQTAVTNPSGNKQDPIFVTLQEAMRSAIVAINQTLDP